MKRPMLQTFGSIPPQIKNWTAMPKAKRPRSNSRDTPDETTREMMDLWQVDFNSATSMKFSDEPSDLAMMNLFPETSSNVPQLQNQLQNQTSTMTVDREGPSSSFNRLIDEFVASSNNMESTSLQSVEPTPIRSLPADQSTGHKLLVARRPQASCEQAKAAHESQTSMTLSASLQHHARGRNTALSETPADILHNSLHNVSNAFGNCEYSATDSSMGSMSTTSSDNFIQNVRPATLPKLIPPINLNTTANPLRLMQASPPTSSATRTFACPKLLSLPQDKQAISSYQCLVRQQIEIFQATEDDVSANIHGRNTSVTLGQIGVRCRHCAHLPRKARAQGATAFPTRLNVVYQTAQNIAKGHLEKFCQSIPEQTRTELIGQKPLRSSRGGGKKYWADGVCALGVAEGHGMLVLR